MAIAYVTIFILFKQKNTSDVIELYYADRVTAAHKILIERYNKLNEGRVKVIPKDFPNFDFSTNERKEILARSLRGRGDGIDLFAVDLVWLQDLQSGVNPWINIFPTMKKENIRPCPGVLLL